MTPMAEQEFLSRAQHGEDELEEALIDFLRSHGFDDMAGQLAGTVQAARNDGRKYGCEEAREAALFDLEHFCGKLRSALKRGDVDAAKTLIDVQLGTDEEGHQLSIEEAADKKAAVQE